VRFDGAAAAEFDRRAGLPESARDRVAEAVIELAELAPAELLLEVGVGTGEIGFALARRAPRYLGFDLSAAMLAELARQAPPDLQIAVVQADAGARWPADDRSVRAVFGSRVLHLLDPDHVVAEARRVASSRGLALIIGRVRRDPESVSAQMRRQMRRFLEEETGRWVRGGPGPLLERARVAGATMLEPRAVARWPVARSPRDSLESWRHKPGLAGGEVSEPLKIAVLDRLAAWALAAFGSLEAPIPSEEAYVLEGVRLSSP
jgi:ubiquinone/menaquinone biosynthesis C-methylase UbiE